MRVLNISNFYYPNVGGIEQVARDLTKALLEKGVTEQKVLCINKQGKETKKYEMDGIEIISCGCSMNVASQYMSSDFAPQLRKFMNEFKPDTVVIHLPNPFNLYHLMKYAGREFRLILYWHSDIVKQKVLGKFFYGLEDRAAQRADVIIATSPNYIDGSRVLSSHRDKCVVVPNCINPDRFVVTEDILKKAEVLKQKCEGKILCFAFGRHVPYKGFEYLEEAKQYLPKDIEVVLGTKLSQEELIAYLYACDIFCFPSIKKNEAFGLALAEGMYFGHPAVTFTIPGSGVNYVSLDGETGIECPNMDSKAYAEAIIMLARDEKLRSRLGRQARERVLENFVYSKYRERICDIIGI